MDDAASLRAAGLRVTAARLAILDAVRQGNHLDADRVARAVRERVGHVSTQAVYDSLHALTAAGLLRRIEPAGSPARYETRVGDNHHHLVCRACGEVTDIDCVVGKPRAWRRRKRTVTPSMRPKWSSGGLPFLQGQGIGALIRPLEVLETGPAVSGRSVPGGVHTGRLRAGEVRPRSAGQRWGPCDIWFLERSGAASAFPVSRSGTGALSRRLHPQPFCLLRQEEPSRQQKIRSSDELSRPVGQHLTAEAELRSRGIPPCGQ